MSLADWLYQRCGTRCHLCGHRAKLWDSAGMKLCGHCHAAKHAEIDRLFWMAGAKRCTQEKCNSRRVS